MNAGTAWLRSETPGATLLQGMPLVLADMLPDGELVATVDFAGPAWMAPTMILGTGPVPRSEWCKREARRIVSEGLSDVLDWLGWPKYTPPSSAAVLAALKGPGGAL